MIYLINKQPRENLIDAIDALENQLKPSYEAFTLLTLKLTKASIVWISFSVGGEHNLKSQRGFEADAEALINFCEQTLIADEGFRYTSPLSRDPIFKDHPLVKNQPTLQTFLGVALVVNKLKVGSLNLCWEQLTELNQDTIDTLKVLALELSKGIERELKIRELELLHSSYHQRTRLLIHDLRNPLMAITGYFSLMNSEKNPPNKEIFDKWMSSCAKNAELMKNLIEEFN